MHNNRLLNVNFQDFNPYQPIQYGHLKNFEEFSKILTENAISLIIGRSGLGKSVHAIYIAAQIKNAILIQGTSGLSPHNLVKTLCVHLKLPLPSLNESNDTKVAHVLTNILTKKPLVVIDNADKLPLDSLALITQIGQKTKENEIRFTLIGLPMLEQRYQTVSAQAPKTLSIQPMQINDIKDWLNQLLQKSNINHDFSEKFFGNIYHQTQGSPRQLSRLAPPMILNQLYMEEVKTKPEKPNKKQLLKFAAPFLFVLSIFGLSQPILTAKSPPKAAIVMNQDHTKAKPVDIVTLVDARLTKDEQFVLKSEKDFIQIGATQNISTMLEWISQKVMTENDIKVVRAIRNNTPYFLVLKPTDSEAPALLGNPWLRKYQSIASDIVEFAKMNRLALLQA